MKAMVHLTNADDVEATLTMSMTIGDWRRLREQLQGPAYPTWKFAKAIRALVERADAHFHEVHEMDLDK